MEVREGDGERMNKRVMCAETFFSLFLIIKKTHVVFKKKSNTLITNKRLKFFFSNSNGLMSESK